MKDEATSSPPQGPMPSSPHGLAPSAARASDGVTRARPRRTRIIAAAIAVCVVLGGVTAVALWPQQPQCTDNSMVVDRMSALFYPQPEGWKKGSEKESVDGFPGMLLSLAGFTTMLVSPPDPRDRTKALVFAGTRPSTSQELDKAAQHP